MPRNVLGASFQHPILGSLFMDGAGVNYDNFSEYNATPRCFAYRLSGYIKDPKYIRSLTEREHGKSPSIEWIKGCIEHRAAKRCVNYEPIEGDDGLHWRPAGLVEKVKSTKPAQINLPPGYTNPFAQKHGLARRIASEVAREFGLSARDVIGRSRKRHIVIARSLTAKLLHEYGWSYNQIGRQLGGRDHSTIMNLVDKWEVYSRYEDAIEACLKFHAMLEDYQAQSNPEARKAA